MALREIASKPYPDQKAGTAGLRKKVAVFQQPHYLENFLQSIFDVDARLKGSTLVIGGDGRYHNRTAIQTAIAMAAANGVQRVVVGQGGILSTPAASHLIRLRKAGGGFVLTASHNPAGEDGDFGIKYNVAGGGQATETLTDKIYEHSRQITRYKTLEGVYVDLERRGVQTVGGMEVEVVDCVDDYAALMQTLFDFDRIRDWFKRGHSLRFDAMHAVTGPYAQRLFVDMLGAPANSLLNASPLEDFGGGHPDPNLIYAKPLVDLMYSDAAADLGAASDGDGDRNMILGRGTFISPGDSLAMLCAHLHELPGYKRGLSGVARSMPTCRAVDQVAKAMGIPCYETPTGWKFFANLLDARRITLCGEESFGTSSDHTREKDGVWAVLAWLNVLAATHLSVRELAERHWKRYGRHYYVRHDYDELSASVATQVMQSLAGSLVDLPGKHFGDYTVSAADEFSYQDPVDGSVAVNQGLRVVFGDAARLIVRLSGTGTKGATLRLYLERYESQEAALGWKTSDALAPLVGMAEKIVRTAEITGRRAPSVIT
ncbi:phosphoglucomutase [Panacagrimonas perspica]|uniref:phosphoglucomutase (alpha-D-glucose-1,6-bisphosphate-dependent) n=1 Tax=Panacagrimonas perspica TaxID=381431 RepID=A0A4S3KBD4_9GAMM|nr:alpha-D-glucose phosphate-specific phosphoglucomutase [Panacagrimonas perspica]TDU32365.1 phosphoglucomutase [Panacagrimonas perspica]THD05676.1 alpha-D-glucose phosphate-specific phosphoglucomutase [Panacagrimonas perspica]